mgnify:CR=1 FL=1|tara:strand:- start:362 stop:568 length:207 start_codon:yes stop_codon:yes gene_type:complete
MEKPYEYHVVMHDSCPCCGNYSTDINSNFSSFAEARDYILGDENAELITNDPIAKYYADDERIKYEGE